MIITLFVVSIAAKVIVGARDIAILVCDEELIQVILDLECQFNLLTFPLSRAFEVTVLTTLNTPLELIQFAFLI